MDGVSRNQDVLLIDVSMFGVGIWRWRLALAFCSGVWHWRLALTFGIGVWRLAERFIFATLGRLAFAFGVGVSRNQDVSKIDVKIDMKRQSTKANWRLALAYQVID